MIAPIVALLFLGVTGGLLVGDLKRPERFWTILVRPQWKSWLARGAFIITAYGAALTAWLALAVFAHGQGLGGFAPVLVILAGLTAGYTAPLLGQCEARDLWQTPLLLPHLIAHALVAGLAVVLIVVGGGATAPAVRPLFVVLLLLTGTLSLIDAIKRHTTANATAAAHALTHGAQSRFFWLALGLGVVLPALLVLAGGASLTVVAATLSLAGLWLHGHAFILAGQGPPIS